MDLDTLDRDLYDLGEGYEECTLTSTRIAEYIKSLEERIVRLEQMLEASNSKRPPLPEDYMIGDDTNCE